MHYEITVVLGGSAPRFRSAAILGSEQETLPTGIDIWGFSLGAAAAARTQEEKETYLKINATLRCLRTIRG